MSGPLPEPLRAEIVNLEALAEALDRDDLTPDQVKELSDRALEIAQRVSTLIAESGASGSGDTGVPTAS